ncbi:MAG: HNH endonuclease [Clostridia bacterium]|nr:HNH endonuclease [Clostridia bacterium]
MSNRKDKRHGVPPRLRFEVFKRDGFKCMYCGKASPEVVLEVDHIIPYSKGGCDDLDNMITACRECNNGKSDIDIIPVSDSDQLVNHTTTMAENTNVFNTLPVIKNKIACKYVHSKIYAENIRNGLSAKDSNNAAKLKTGLNQTIRTTQRDLKQLYEIGLSKDFIAGEDVNKVVHKEKKFKHAQIYIDFLSQGYSSMEANEQANIATGLVQSPRTTQRDIECLKLSR